MNTGANNRGPGNNTRQELTQQTTKWRTPTGEGQGQKEGHEKTKAQEQPDKLTRMGNRAADKT